MNSSMLASEIDTFAKCNYLEIVWFESSSPTQPQPLPAQQMKKFRTSQCGSSGFEPQVPAVKELIWWFIYLPSVTTVCFDPPLQRTMYVHIYLFIYLPSVAIVCFDPPWHHVWTVSYALDSHAGQQTKQGQGCKGGGGEIIIVFKTSDGMEPYPSNLSLHLSLFHIVLFNSSWRLSPGSGLDVFL